MMIFPLSIAGKIVLICIAVVLGVIFWMMSKPAHWKWLFDALKKKNKEE
ncbi:hypothetical protein GOV11_04815 [Candidatus Woesearchaeota archaeon]|nr:hypothetical protein [Candidatus Woesearchaeota archaeon]